MARKLGELLVESGLITEQDLGAALARQRVQKSRLGEALVELGLCTENDIAGVLSTQLGIPFTDLKITPVEPMAIDVIPERVARKHLIIPIAVEGKSLQVAMADPLRFEAIEDLRFASGLAIKPCVATRSDIEWAIEHHYNLGSSLDSVMRGLSTGKTIEVVPAAATLAAEDEEDLKRKSEAAPVIRIVNLIISEAVGQGASDIHVEPTKERLLIRNRVDGMLRESLDLPKWVQGAVISRMKIMAKMDIAEKRLPQDGRVGVRVSGKVLDIRVSTLPTIYGEKIVLRLLDPRNAQLSVEELGMSPTEMKGFLSLLSQPQGIILVTGPTGSGKTTSLYAMLSKIRDVSRNITTIEDPVEYELEGVNQTAANEKVGLVFSTVLRSILRQDPDVIMVGEMRDLDTASIAMQAALTGHLVLSTLHTNSSIASVTRLRNLGLPSYLISTTIIGIIAQRLVRILCPHCKTPDPTARERLVRLGMAPAAEDVTVYRAQGCGTCSATGYKGRTGLYEILSFTRRIKDLIAADGSEADIRKAALTEGMRMLPQAGLERILDGTTSIDEILRVVQTDEEFGGICPTCGGLLAADFNACPHCGRSIAEICPRCRRTVDANWRYCAYCRYEVHRTAPAK